MARHKRKSSGVPVVQDVENFLDGLTESVEGLGETVVSFAQSVISWLRSHKKLAITVLVLVIAYNWLNNRPYRDEE